MNLREWKEEIEIRQHLDEIARIEERKRIMKTIIIVGVAIALIVLYLRCKNAP